MPVWKPGGRNVAYLCNRNGNFDVRSRSADGTGKPELLLDLDESLSKFAWSPDGEWLLLWTGGDDILGYRPGEDDEPIPVMAEAYVEANPAVSPDGQRPLGIVGALTVLVTAQPPSPQ